ncbi:putative esterase [Gaiella occulta]|uniref:Putative esterase n=1 Tax=Gaiella occulta TaxID=1002870 RepID=A0A7M2Z212_9ACTN|nr:alpha/beta hydrolase-fold protein [Gaiella occulta]RDI76199.1 putative esterase [Gaiella occulta]
MSGQAVDRTPSRKRRPRALRAALLAVAAAAFVAPGLLGLVRYLDNYWLYRGYPPPKDPAFVDRAGTTQTIAVASPALGGRRQTVIVYLPPGYARHAATRYPVFYLLHGFPGRPAAFLQTVRLGVVEDILLAKRKARPLILVMPFGSTGTFTDKEWANGVRAGEGWETFVARDLVRAIDARYRTVRSGGGRALGGLSEGGYGAVNIGLHHPGRFRVLESWSGYMLADRARSIFGTDPRRLAHNSPLLELPGRAAALRRAHTFVWFYSGRRDKLRVQNAAFASALARARIPHRFFLVSGGHNWSLWRGNASLAFLAASRRLARG